MLQSFASLFHFILLLSFSECFINFLFFFLLLTIEKVGLSWTSCVLQVEGKEGPKSISGFCNTCEPLLSLLP